MKHRREEKWQAKLGVSAFDPLQTIELQDAIRRRDEIVLIGKREFQLTYYSTVEGEKVHFTPVEGFIPMGHLDVKRFLEG